jgi:hypothetical protein
MSDSEYDGWGEWVAARDDTLPHPLECRCTECVHDEASL